MSAQASVSPRLPLGVGGRLTARWVLFAVIAGLLVLFGIVEYSRQATQGLVVTGMRDIGPMGGSVWALYIAFDVYFVGVSFAGITVAALIRLLDLEKLKPIARMAEVLTVVSLILASFTVLADLGQPLRGIVNLFRYARPQSPFFGTFTLVLGGYLFSSLVYLYLDGRADAARLAKVPSRLQWLHRGWAAGYQDTPAERERHQRTTRWLAMAIIPLLVTAHSTLGFIFGLQVGRPGWFSALQAPAFVVMAGVSGLGLVIVLAALVRRGLHQESRITGDAFATLGRFLMVLLFVYLYFMVVDMLTTQYAAGEHERRISDAVLSGDYAWIYWSSVVLLVVPVIVLLWQDLTKRWSIGLLVACGIAVNIAAIGKRFLIVVPAQTKGTLLPYAEGSYSPTIVEIGVVIGLFGLGALLILLFAKLFPIMETEEETHA